MPKKPHEIDDIDLDIIDLLMENARYSCSEIATRIGGITERAVRFRMDYLLKNKIITLYLYPDFKRLGLMATADVFLRVEPGRLFEIADQLVAYPCINWVGCSTGLGDISVQVTAKDNAELLEFVNNVLGKLPGVTSLSVAFVPIVLKFSGWRIKDAIKIGTKGGPLPKNKLSKET